MNWHTIVTPIERTDPFLRREGIDITGEDLRTANSQRLYVEGQIQASTWPAVAVALIEFWQRAAELFGAALPGEPSWDRLHIRVMPEGGQLKTYLSDTKNPLRVSPLVVNAIVDLMGDQYDALPDPEEFEAEFGEGYDQLCFLARDALIVSSATPAAGYPMRRLLEEHGLRVFMRWEETGEGQELVFS